MAKLIALNDLGRVIGQGHHAAKMSDRDVEQAFALREQGHSLSAIAERFGVGKAAIWKIVHAHRRAQLPAGWRVAGQRRSGRGALASALTKTDRRGALELASALRNWASVADHKQQNNDGQCHDELDHCGHGSGTSLKSSSSSAGVLI